MTGCVHIVIAMKPVEAGFAENALKHGVAGINVDGCRVEAVGGRPGRVIDAKETVNNVFAGRMDGSLAGGSKAVGDTTLGRWPANVILGHAKGCVLKGTKKVKNIDARMNSAQQTGAIFGSTKQTRVGPRGYADAEGKETVADWECAEGCSVKRLGEQSGEVDAHIVRLRTDCKGGMFGGGANTDRNRYEDTGTAARFFKQIKEYEDETSGREQDEGR